MTMEQTGGRQGTGHREPREAPRHTLPTLVLHLLWTRARGALIWGVALGLYTGAMVASFPTFEATGQLEQLTRTMPEGMKAAFGGMGLSTIEGFLAAEVFALIAPLALSFFPILALSAAIAGSEERGTMDVVLGRPLPRWQLVVGSFVATALSLLGVVAIVGLFAWVPAALVDVGLPVGTVAGAVLNLWPICLFFGALALLCSAVFHRRVLAIAIPGAVLLGMYLLDVLGKLSEDFEGLRRASAFRYYGSAVEDGIEWAHFAGLTAAALVLVALAVIAFRRRDIYT